MSSYMKESLAPSDRKILSLLYVNGDLTKTEISKLADMPWATVTGSINRLVEKKYLVEAGLGSSHRPGKRAVKFSINREYPYVIGIDIEYSSFVSMLLTNLRGDVLCNARYKSPISIEEGEAFLKSLKTTIMKFIRKIKKLGFDMDSIQGLGVAMPGLFNFSIKKNARALHQEVAAELEDRFKMTTSVETTTRAYTIFEKMKRFPTDNNSFVLLSIRTGIGTGIVLNGSLFYGETGHSGELAHFHVSDNQKLCRCGKKGCLETLVNQKVFHDNLLEFKNIEDKGGRDIDQLFSLAGQGHKQSLECLREAADHLGRGLSYLLQTLGITDVYLRGHFGKDGDLFARMISDFLDEYMLSQIHHNVSYSPFDLQGHTHGAALLITKEFFV